MEKLFIMCCTRDQVGTSASWHAQGGGYTTDILKASVYTKEEAQRYWNSGREIDIPVSRKHAYKSSYLAVDCQNVDSLGLNDYADMYVKAKKGRWDGNNLFFLKEDGSYTNNIESGLYITDKKPEPEECNLIYSFSDVVWASRSVFDWNKYNARVMTQGAGLVIPDRIKKIRRRKPQAQNRINCTKCGVFFYSGNPYQDLCKKHN